MSKAFPKLRPQPPRWFYADYDNCWDCNCNKKGCRGCKRLKQFKKYDRTRTKRIFRRNQE